MERIHESLPNNYDLSLRRLTSLLHRLRRSPNTLDQYSAIIREQLNMGIIEPVEKIDPPARTHCLPHHAVVRHDKDTTKVRRFCPYQGSFTERLSTYWAKI